MKIFLVFLFVSLILTIQISYESGFQKELDLNIPFPPILDRREGKLRDKTNITYVY